MDGILGPAALNNIGVVSGSLILVFLFVTDRIVSGRRLRRVESQLERWQETALESLKAAKVVVPAAEAVHKITAAMAEAEDVEAEEAP
jgi:hypothetical protein